MVLLIGIYQYLGFGPGQIPSVGQPTGTFVFRNLAASYLIGNIWFGLLPFLLDSSMRRKLLWVIATLAMLLFSSITCIRGAWVGLTAALVLATLACVFLTVTFRKLVGTLNPLFLLGWYLDDLWSASSVLGIWPACRIRSLKTTSTG
ncbi:MAG: hypothetical protein CME25_16540 [Gemmatimonadetes bacterium]|nr:hypothetical protein [Gemmatimonadota bacterium]